MRLQSACRHRHVNRREVVHQVVGRVGLTFHRIALSVREIARESTLQGFPRLRTALDALANKAVLE